VEKRRKRGERRDRSWWYAKRAQWVHLTLGHGLGPIDCVCEQSVWFFRKRQSLGCGCRAKQKGAPKLPGGMCSRGEGHYRDTVAERIRGRRLGHAWLGVWGCLEPDDIEL
jgi:hypothetical protein